jgi:acetylornithine deacetylase/succinyl-diaminopimelate desuccinylase-like protein
VAANGQHRRRCQGGLIVGASVDASVGAREGGSGSEAAIQQTLGAPLVFLGVGLPDDQIHAPNEKVTISMLYRGAEAAAHLWAELAILGCAGLAG